MSHRFNPVVVGAFVLGALALGALALISFGGRHFLQEAFRFVVVIPDSSVSGLDPGSPVKLNGVRVGRVESVNAIFDQTEKRVTVRVVCDLDETVARALIAGHDYDPGKLMYELIAAGLHAKLSFGGITGLLYVDLLMEPAEAPAPVGYEADTSYPVVPATPSLLSEFSDTLSTIANGLASVDFAGLAAELKTLLASANRTLGDLDVKPALARVETAAAAVEALAGSPELRETLANLNLAVGDLRHVLGGLQEATPELRERLQTVLDQAAHTLRRFDEAAATVDGLVGARSGVPDDLARTLDSLQRAAQAVERLAEYLERNPGALLRGRAPANAATPR